MADPAVGDHVTFDVFYVLGGTKFDEFYGTISEVSGDDVRIAVTDKLGNPGGDQTVKKGRLSSDGPDRWRCPATIGLSRARG